ncbi:MAG: STAS domain-containing protein [Muribaculaceae bacterium]
MIEFNIVKREADAIVADLSGELDTAAARTFASYLEAFSDDDVKKQITINFDRLEYISSAGMRILLVLAKRASVNGRKVTLSGMSEDVKQIFQLTGFDNMFAIQ